MGKIIMYFLMAIFFFVSFGPALGQTVILKSGQRVEGQIVEQTDKYVKMEFQGVGLIFYTEEIASIEQTPSTADTGTAAGQIEKFYQGYLAARNAPPEVLEEAESLKTSAKDTEQKQVQEEKSAQEEKPEGAMSGSEDAALPKDEQYLMKVPPEYRDTIKAELAKIKANKSSAGKADQLP